MNTRTASALLIVGSRSFITQGIPPVGEFLPVANLQDQPLRIPDSIAFEDWPDTPDSEPEAGARSPEGASMAASEAIAAIKHGNLTVKPLQDYF